jgi:hypothetical protein
MARTCAALLITSLLAAPALAQDAKTCVASHESGLALRKSGKLIEARKDLTACAAEACPAPIKADCRSALGEINAMLPGVVFDVKDASNTSVTQVKVSVDGAPLVDHLDGMAVPVNPGQHKFTFEVAGQPPVEKTFLIAEGDKAHRETIMLGTPGTTGSASTGPKGGEGESCGATSDCAEGLHCVKLKCTNPNGTPAKGSSADTNTTPGESSHSGIYVQTALGVGFLYFPNIGFGTSYDWAGFRPDLEFGFHVSGRHDGFVIGLRQSFTLTALQAHAGGASQLRLGYDIPVTVVGHELSIDPFAAVGIGYIFDGVTGFGGPSAGIVATGGIDVKFFLAGGFFAFVRPFEGGVQCYHDVGLCAFDLVVTAGAGGAFGGK